MYCIYDKMVGKTQDEIEAETEAQDGRETTDREKLVDAIEKFEEQFDVDAQYTGHEFSAEENGGILEIEAWTNGLIESPFNGLNIDVGGWFSYDTRHSGFIYCRLTIKLDNEPVAECKALQAEYDIKSEEWSSLRWDAF